MNTRLALLSIWLGLALLGCSPGQILGPTVTPSPTSTPIPTSTPVPTATYTPTLRPTSTAIPATATATPSPLVALADVCDVPDGSVVSIAGYPYLGTVGAVFPETILVIITEKKQGGDPGHAGLIVLTGDGPNQMSGAPDVEMGKTYNLSVPEQQAVSIWTEDGEELSGPGHRVGVSGTVYSAGDECMILVKSIVAMEQE